MARFGRPAVSTARAPGRVNLIGEHTDYNGGHVLPTPVPQVTEAACAPRGGDRVRVASAGFGVAEYVLGGETRGRGWLDYVQGVTWALRAGGHPLGGFDLAIASSVPSGVGLASSAALEVAVLRALRGLGDLALDDVALAPVAQRAEVEFVGVRVGIMDQMAASFGRAGRALLIDTRDLTHREIPLPSGAALVVLDSGIPHRHVHGGYNDRRRECEEAARRLGVAHLCDLEPGDLGRTAGLPASLARRVRHVVGENARVRAAVAAIDAGDVGALGALLSASHASQRDDYEVSVAEIDQLAALACAVPDVFGARLTGGGFGGAVLILVRAGVAAQVAERVMRAYARATGRTPRLLVPAAGTEAVR